MLATSRFADQKASPAGVEMGFMNVVKVVKVLMWSLGVMCLTPAFALRAMAGKAV